MRKLFLFILIIILLATAVNAAPEKKFKDIGDQHWAAPAVYNLVKLGITQGFPDGTFRGKNKISRYEVASFLSKLSDAMGGVEMKQLKDELRLFRDEMVRLKKSSEMPVSGSLGTVLRYGNLMYNDVAGHGPVANYRLMTSIIKDLGQGTSVKVNIDTMDAGFYGGSGDLSTNLFDFEGKMKVDPAEIGLSEIGIKNPLDVVLTVGPGGVQHVDSTNILLSENGRVYSRPDTGIALKTDVNGIKLGGGYYSVGYEPSGKINTNRLQGMVGYTFNKAFIADNLELSATGDYYVKSPLSNGAKDLRAVINLSAPYSKKIKVDTIFGLGSSQQSGMMVGAAVHLNDLWNTGTKISLSGSKIGGNYISMDEQLDYAGLDNFDRPLENSTVNIGGQVVQSLNRKWALKGKGDIRLSPDFKYGNNNTKSRATAQVGLAYDIAPQTVFDAFYRVEQDPTISQTSDITAAGLLYRF
ncbi:S-layer homology domain-containing protein [Candidatus Margulisiibacteriota bacterium]